MNKSKPLEYSKNSFVFFGTEHYSDVVLKTLLERGVVISTVITKPDSRSGRGKKITPPAVKKTAEGRSIRVLQPNSLDEIRDSLTEINCDFAVLAAYGKILPKRTLDLFKDGIINIHPSLLPAWRGPSPVEATILAGESETGVSIIKLSQKMDAGPVFVQEAIKLNGTETKPQLYNRLFELGAGLLANNLEAIISKELTPTVQDESSATYSKLISKADGILDLSKKSADQLEAEVRAYAGWPRSRINLGSHLSGLRVGEVVVTKARVAKSAQDGALILPCSKGFLEILELVAPSGKTMSGEAFQRGYKA